MDLLLSSSCALVLDFASLVTNILTAHISSVVSRYSRYVSLSLPSFLTILLVGSFGSSSLWYINPYFPYFPALLQADNEHLTGID
ncbi:hypothetical protein B0H12DRAFT_1121845 [Mycena haematopus]|nr:hypothetical protein B0H12DRAFT_1121845 [Mycena haematopus]